MDHLQLPPLPDPSGKLGGLCGTIRCSARRSDVAWCVGARTCMDVSYTLHPVPYAFHPEQSDQMAHDAAYSGICPQGWRFTAVQPGLSPPVFWGLRRPCLESAAAAEEEEEEEGEEGGEGEEADGGSGKVQRGRTVLYISGEEMEEQVWLCAC